MSESCSRNARYLCFQSQGIYISKGRVGNDLRFDFIVCFRTLSAISDPAKLLTECAGLLESGGFFLLGSETSDGNEHRKSAARVQGERLAYNILAGDHLKNSFTEQELKELLTRAGFKVHAQIDAPDWATPALVCTI